MYLTKEEEAILSGEKGEALRLAMEILVKLGDAFGAKRMIGVCSSHTAGSQFTRTMDVGIEILEKFAELRAKTAIMTTRNPSPAGIEYYKWIGISEVNLNKQKRLDVALARLGVISTFSCTPYNCVNCPKFGDNIAWSEANAVVYANSIIGARTPRYGIYADLCAAIVGKAPEYDLYLEENRYGRVLVRINACDLSEVDYNLIGLIIGRKLGTKIPVIVGLPKNVTMYQLFLLGSAISSSGAIPMFHVPGVTPEAKTVEDAFRGNKPEETLEIDREEIRKEKESVCTASGGKVDLVVLGCPHLPISKVAEIANLLEGEKINSDVELWVCVSPHVKILSDYSGYTKIIERAGGRMAVGVCFIDEPDEVFNRFDTVISDSGKLAYTTPSVAPKTNIILSGLKECIDGAVEGYAI
jgi:predicted aconitase